MWQRWALMFGSNWVGEGETVWEEEEEEEEGSWSGFSWRLFCICLLATTDRSLYSPWVDWCVCVCIFFPSLVAEMFCEGGSSADRLPRIFSAFKILFPWASDGLAEAWRLLYLHLHGFTFAFLKWGWKKRQKLNFFSEHLRPVLL